MYTEEEYKNYYLKNRVFPDGQYSNKDKVLNDKQIKTKYEKYCKRTEKKKVKENSDYMNKVFEVEAECKKDNPNAERFYNKIQELDKEWNTNFESYFRKMNKIFGDIYDPAHILGRSPRFMAVEKENIEILPRFVHSNLDQYLEIFDKEYKHYTISKERHEEIWRLIIGNERYDELLQLKSST